MRLISIVYVFKRNPFYVEVSINSPVLFSSIPSRMNKASEFYKRTVFFQRVAYVSECKNLIAEMRSAGLKKFCFRRQIIIWFTVQTCEELPFCLTNQWAIKFYI